MTNLRLHIVHPNGASQVRVEVTGEAFIQQFIRALVPRLSLPEFGPDGAPLPYSLYLARGGAEYRLSGDQTFAAQAVQAGDTLYLRMDAHSAADHHTGGSVGG